MPLLTKDQILNADDLKFEDVKVPEWGGAVRVRTMTGTDRDQYEQYIVNIRSDKKDDNLANIRSMLLAHTVVDDNGELLFTKDDIEALGLKSVKALQRLFNVASKLNALNDSDIEDLAGN
jgi:hypothetical protein